MFRSRFRCRFTGCLLPGDYHRRPIEHNLLFERFLNPERKGMPDIDIDFDAARRDETIDSHL